ncbi:hypothetical protein D3C72_1713750 [compost metagenome]
MGTAQRLCPRLGQAKVLHLPFLDQRLHRTGDVFNRHIGIHPVLIKQIDRFDVKTL